MYKENEYYSSEVLNNFELHLYSEDARAFFIELQERGDFETWMANVFNSFVEHNILDVGQYLEELKEDREMTNEMAMKFSDFSKSILNNQETLIEGAQSAQRMEMSVSDINNKISEMMSVMSKFSAMMSSDAPQLKGNSGLNLIPSTDSYSIDNDVVVEEDNSEMMIEAPPRRRGKGKPNAKSTLGAVNEFLQVKMIGKR